MRQIAMWMVALAVAAAPALAQEKPRFQFGFGTLLLLSNKSVQDELKLTEDQVKRITDLGEKEEGSRQEESKLINDLVKRIDDLPEKRRETVLRIDVAAR